MNKRTPPLLVLAIGNPSRGDDAVGPLLGERLTTWLSQQSPELASQVDVIVEQQLMVEHLLDMQGRQHILFIDAAASGVKGHHLAPVTLLPAPQLPGHACQPGELLGLFLSTLNADPPSATLMAVEGHQFELGQPLSEFTKNHAEAAWRILLENLTRMLGSASPCA